jgi:hypothetical protein
MNRYFTVVDNEGITNKIRKENKENLVKELVKKGYNLFDCWVIALSNGNFKNLEDYRIEYFKLKNSKIRNSKVLFKYLIENYMIIFEKLEV